jgi:uncharacterized protein
MAILAMSSIQWLPWRAETFARARAEEKPVLLSIVASWCRTCHEMDQTSYVEPRVTSLVNDRFVPIRVDADRRPDISDRYSLGGWPTTAFLTADGRVVGGGTYVGVDRMADVLERVVTAFTTRAGEIADRATSSTGQTDESAASTDGTALTASIFDTFDDTYGGFGTEPKFPLTWPIRLALDLYGAEGSSRMAHIATSSLDAMGWGPLYDEVEGGFFRCAATRDWQRPSSEKMLDVNAALARMYLDAADALKAARYRERAEDVLRWLQSCLADPVDGGWAGSQCADDDYYAETTADGRRLRTAPAVDRVLYAGWNAGMVSTAFKSAHVLGDAGLGEFALQSLERLLLVCYKPGGGVAHYFDGEAHVRGLLDDQIGMASASLDAYDATGNVVYEMMAEELVRYATRTMWDAEGGGFFDRADVDEAERIGLMSRRLKPFASNCDAAMVLHRLVSASGDHEFAAMAKAILEGLEPTAGQYGPEAAHYVVARRTVTGS